MESWFRDACETSAKGGMRRGGSIDSKLQLDGRRKFCCSIAQKGEYRNINVLCISKRCKYYKKLLPSKKPTKLHFII
jgi:hypothetical protein